MIFAVAYLGEGFSAVIESVEAGLGAPDPQQLAEMNRMAFKIKGETSDSEDGSFEIFRKSPLKSLLVEPEVSTNQIEKDESAVNQDGWLNALSLEKLTSTVREINQSCR